jgi:putative FmdB family regulatory protein
MPIYEFKCENCGHSLEKLMKSSDPFPTTCPECEQENVLKKQMSTNTGFLLKGYGWHRNGLSASSRTRK